MQSSSFSFNINGKVKGYIHPSWGIREGDSLSPYLFLFCSEVFSNLISEAVLKKELMGVKISKSGPAFTHILFTDNSLLFCEVSSSKFNV